MEFSGIIITLLFLVVLGLLAFSLTEARGKNTAHARKDKSNSTNGHISPSFDNSDSISKSYSTSYTIKDRKTEAA